MNYQDFINKKTFTTKDAGFDSATDLSFLFDYQQPIVQWACQRGKAAIFADTGLGKTAMQLAWCKEVAIHNDDPVLILAPLAVAAQTIAEGEKFGIKVHAMDDTDFPSGARIYITNYEQLHKLSPDWFCGICLDESSILKGLQGKVRKAINEFAEKLPFRLSCTATPSPNDFMELGSQCEFLGIMSQPEMLSMFFTHDSARTSKWRLKGHGKRRFFEWMSSWAVLIKSPSDLGFDGSRHQLPPIEFNQHTVGQYTGAGDSAGLMIRNRIRKESTEDRCRLAADIVNASDDIALVWCYRNDESALLAELIDGAVEVKGSDKPEHKTKSLLGFAAGDIKTLVSKPSIAGYGMNFQVCNHAVFVGLSDSWEQYYQAVRRIHRFGQQRDCRIDIVTHADEGAVLENIQRKDRENEYLSEEMTALCSRIFKANIEQATIDVTPYVAKLQPEFPLLCQS